MLSYSSIQHVIVDKDACHEKHEHSPLPDDPCIAILILHLIGKREPISIGLGSAGIIITIIVLAILQLVPILGGLISFLLLLIGLGALNLKSWRVYKAA